MNINNEIIAFADYLNKSFKEVFDVSQKIEIERKNIFLADKIENGYLQFIWEIIVESLVCNNEEFIEPYGDGADFDEMSSRVTYPMRVANRKVIVHVKESVDLLSGKNYINQNFDFIKLVSFDGKAYSQNVPFAFALCDDSIGGKYLFNIKTSDFILA